MTELNKIGSVMVIGGGIGGIQASLDLAELGYKVYLVEKNPSIGGVMAQLDKTFPTNDCSMCILAPKMVEVGRNPNIELYAYCEISKITGEAGNFEVSILKKARFVDSSKCVACGSCSEKCPTKLPDEYNEYLGQRKAIYAPFPQAVPSTYLIDQVNCLFFKKGVCRICEKNCKAEAINFEQKDQIIKVNVGSVIIALGSGVFDASILSQYGYKQFPNVITSIEFERILNASGPFGGHVVRPSDQKTPKKLLWLNCVGSRNSKIKNNYCSSVCCMYSIKEAIIAKEHNPDLECYNFYIDIRAVGKGFEEYYLRAKDLGIKFIKGRVSILDEDPSNHNVIVKYENIDTGELFEEEFELAILSVGFQPSTYAIDLCKELGIDLNKYNFCLTHPFSPLETSKPGIYVCGTLSGPKDIPETVAEASGSVEKASLLLQTERYKLISEKEYPPEKSVEGQEARIGAFICHCGINIGSVVNVPKVVEYIKSLPNVVYAEENLYTCSSDTQEKIKQVIKENELNRIVVASCTPRTHEPLFQNTIREAGLNAFLFELANIREHCSWVHMKNPEEATEKAKEIIAASVARAKLLEPIEINFVDVVQAGLVIGGGIAGMTVALELANQGFQAYLIEKEMNLGGLAQKLHYILEGDDPQEYLKVLREKIMQSDKIKVHLGTKIVSINGYVGNFNIIAKTNGEEINFDVGTIIVATGGQEYKPTEYLYGKDMRILTQHELEQQIFENKINSKKVVMIQCVGSRNSERPYCSRICCSVAIKNALKLKEKDPNIEIFILYRDIRTYGFAEEYYELARKNGITFIRFNENSEPNVNKIENNLVVSVNNILSGKNFTIEPDLIVLSTAFLAADSKELSQMLKVPLDESGFFLEAHVKLRPLDFSTDGIFLCGAAQWPKFIKESISQANGAAARAIRLLSAKKIKTDAIIASVDMELCMGCRSCEWICPFSAIQVQRTDQGLKAIVIQSACKGCGVCGASCPQKAISMGHFTDNQLNQQLFALTDGLLE